MKRILFMLALLPTLAFAQNTRWDMPGGTLTTQASGGNLLPVYAIPGSQISFYNMPAMTLASTYNSATSTSACPTGSQVVLQGSAACVSSADSHGNFGAWFASGQYRATITSSNYGTYNYDFTVGGGGSSFSLNSLTGAVTLVPGAGITITPSGNTLIISTANVFNIYSFSGCSGYFELGYTISNPTCSATYSATPTSATITNTDGVNSPLTLVTPFTSGTIAGLFSHSTVSTTTVTLTAVGSSTQTANQTYTWNPRSFGGIGSPGATATVTPSGTTAILSTTDVLQSVGLTSSNVGQTYGPFSPSGQSIYLLIIGGSHTFIDPNTGFPFAFNSPTAVSFVNVNGVTVPMYLYQSTNVLYTTFYIKVQS